MDKTLSDKTRSAIALIFIISGTSLSMFSSDKVQVVVRTILVCTGFIMMIPIFKRKYGASAKDWRIFLLVSTMGVMVYLGDAIYQFIRK